MILRLIFVVNGIFCFLFIEKTQINNNIYLFTNEFSIACID